MNKIKTSVCIFQSLNIVVLYIVCCMFTFNAHQMMDQNIIRLFLFCMCITNIQTARILAVFPTPSISHQLVFRPLTQELAKRGHEVIVITPDPAFSKGKQPANLTEINVHNVSYSIWNEMISPKDNESRDWLEQMDVVIGSLSDIFEKQMKTDVVRNFLSEKQSQFDLLLLEACVRTTLGLSYVFKAPVIQVSSLGSAVDNYNVVGAPSHPLLYPSMIRDRLFNLTMWEKVKQLKKELQFNMLLHKLQRKEDTVMKRIFGDDIPPLDELYNNVDMLFLNVHPIWENNRPVPPNVVYLGGIHQVDTKEIPKDLQSYLDSSKNGIIYFSLGSNVKPSMVPFESMRKITNVFSRLPYDILMEWDNDDLPGWTKNIKLSKWLPQSELLKHPKVKLFITQGGLQSSDEAISAAVPLIVMPIFADQWYNAEMYNYHKIGIQLDILTLEEENFENAIKTILSDKSYSRNIAKLRDLMHDQPQRPLDRAVWWTEYVLRHGGARHMRSTSANITWSNYLELKLLSFTAVLLSLILFILYMFARSIWFYIYLIMMSKNKLKRS